MKSYSLQLIAAISLVTFLAFSFSSCDSDDDDSGKVPEETLVVNKWIDENMKDYYLWNENIPSSVNYHDEADPAELFKKMLFSSEDKWSWITNDWASLNKEMKGTPVSMGFSPAFFYKDDTSNDIMTIIEYVYKDSPADKAGLKRGDVILSYNGQVPNDQNYYELYSGNSYSVELGHYSAATGDISSTGESVDLVATSFKANPVIFSEVKTVSNHQIGYLVYSDFTPGVNDAFLDSIDGVMDSFKEESVTDVIVDLRYNPGGELDAAVHLASALAPASAVTNKELLIKMTYNSLLQDYFESLDDDSNLNCRFSPSASNLNLSSVYFLTTSGTASASELVIAGLKPYMNVVMVGDSTYGKYAGAWVLPDMHNPPLHNWCMLPVVLKYENANGYTDFKKGIVPDIYVYDYLLPAHQFGDPEDEVLARAISQITGGQVASTKSAVRRIKRKQLHPKAFDIRKTMTVPIPETFQPIVN